MIFAIIVNVIIKNNYMKTRILSRAEKEIFLIAKCMQEENCNNDRIKQQTNTIMGLINKVEPDKCITCNSYHGTNIKGKCSMTYKDIEKYTGVAVRKYIPVLSTDTCIYHQSE